MSVTLLQPDLNNCLYIFIDRRISAEELIIIIIIIKSFIAIKIHTLSIYKDDCKRVTPLVLIAPIYQEARIKIQYNIK